MRLGVSAFVSFVAFASSVSQAASVVTREQALETMKRATTFMVEKVSHHGGYVWSYLPDMSRRWGEIEARPTMVWIQSGTPSMGHVFLDAYHATGDAFYYRAAEAVGDVLIAVQHPSGGWNYVADLAGEESLREWYGTIGRNAWRLEEFQHYCGNATFDDSTTPDAARFMLRLFLEKREPRFGEAVERVVRFVVRSQYPMGGWPQRWPHAAVGEDCPDYARHVTLNDRVGSENMDFLMHCYGTLGDERLLEPIRRGMDAFLLLQQPAPQPGWALQYEAETLLPAAARTYEPASLSSSATAACIRDLMTFYERTGDERYLAHIPEAIAWLEAITLPPHPAHRGSHPTFVEIGTGRTLYVHRSGSNAANGRYYVDYDPKSTVTHYNSTRNIDVAGLKRQYERLRAASVEPAAPGELFRDGVVPTAFPKYVGGNAPAFVAAVADRAATERIERIVSGLNADGWWPTPLRFTSNPYRGPAPEEVAPGDYVTTLVGDDFDTSMYRTDTPETGISITSYMGNMRALIGFVGVP
jgi:PelA/Pel-15E family pectate lyase